MHKIKQLYKAKKRLISSDLPTSDRRLVLVFRFVQVTILLNLINILYLSISQSVDDYLPLFVLLLFPLFIVEYINRLVKCGQRRKSINIFLGLALVILPFVVWFEGGLLSPTIIMIPAFVMFAALYATFRDFVVTVTILTIAVFIVCLNGIYGWLPSNPAHQLSGFPRLIATFIATVTSVYVTWAIGTDLHVALKEVDTEHEQVKKSQSRVEALSQFDLLTGLHNRKSSKDIFNKMFLELDKTRQRMVFFFIDLDSFKSINDLFDHSAGDEVIITIADRIQLAVPEGTIVGRMGGDEFTAFLVVDKDFDEDKLAKKILKYISKKHHLFGSPAAVTASIGVASSNEDSFDLLLKKADMAMYLTKNKEKNGYHHYTAELEKKHMKNTIIQDQLKDSLKQELFELHYQPKIDIHTNETIGVEALIRWVKNNPNNYGPGEFMPVMESTKLVHDIGDWVIKEACKTGKHWHDLGHPLTMAVNVSSKQLTNDAFAEQVKAILEVTKFPPEYLQIELTEQFLINENEIVNKQLESLKRLGVSLAIDDFGTGYSNIGYLTRLNVDALKIDQSFVRQLSDPDGICSVIRAITKTAKVMGMKVVMEGIETPYELEQVAELGCDIGQGYLWSKPKPASQLLEQLSSFGKTPFDMPQLS
ncbi:EAL domain-containing protein [Cocleimonas sp. KMM 6892]|uniref:putative bifunctional diguanylate cyclase/phosphodiesterase n=1 Tax=unclassified Cocleimonas TaxID=2639732 RepID=UPI002DB58EF3|nr:MULTISPECIES: EAL domain-containing protein [unclassified Cocleimonas]MEB8434297.1 EAL domain-containing protein [Cocleimonas sp. KMM 6892]MEC4717084.1 EAL domain-containing protein [Cocleimonas sp. KMM 6895]MEC4746569.1 EAL domain-containing protein [Cocleimonas sp. KMM 6896]